MVDYVRLGDNVCLYCEDTRGYVHSSQTSSTNDGLFSFINQDKDQPAGIPNIHAVTFQLCSVNRYKLTKKYRALHKQHGDNPEQEDIKRLLKDSKRAADVEESDNTSEQARLLGKTMKYGDKVQLLHVFTNKYVHISTDDTSAVDKSKMMVTLQKFSSKNAQFMIMPRYKIKNTGDPLERNDQIVLESVKSPGNYIHASDPYQVDSFTLGSEMNAGVDKTGFTVMIFNRSQAEDSRFLKGGDVIRLFHMDIEAYLVAEGTWGQEPAENVHLRIREANPKEPRTLYRPKSGITYWQVEHAVSIIKGTVIRWEDSVRFRHMTTRRYLAVSDEHDIFLNEDGLDPSTVFRLHSLSQNPENSQVHIDKNGRIEHVVTGCWVYAPVDVAYIKIQSKNNGKDGSDLEGLEWDGADLLQVSATSARQYRDAFTLQKVAEQEWRSFNYVAGMIPFIKDLTEKRKDPKFLLTSRETVAITVTSKDLRDFITAPKIRVKDRQKLLRNLNAVDVIVDLLKIPIDSRKRDSGHLHEVFREMYKVLHTYTKGNSRKNSLYAAQYIPFFMTQLSEKGNVGSECCKMLVDLIRDNRRIVDRIKPDFIKTIINLFNNRKNHLYLELLCVLCDCDGIAMTENQTLIAEDLLQNKKEAMIHIEMGQDISMNKDILYVSCDNGSTYVPLHTFCYKSNIDYDHKKYLYLIEQLELFKKLCSGRNQTAINIMTRNREFFTWEVAYLGLKSEVVPFKMRAKFCDLLISLFIDVGDNYSIISVTSNNFVYDEIDITNYGQSEADSVPHDFDRHFPSMRAWLTEFFRENQFLISSQPARNELIKEVLHLVTSLIRYGFMGTRDEMNAIMDQVSNMIDGSKDVPFPPGKGTEFSPEEKAMVKAWRKDERYKAGEETDAIIQAKLEGLELIEILLVKEFNRRVRFFVSIFKKLETGAKRKSKGKKPLTRLIYDKFEEEALWTDSKLKKKIVKFFKVMYEKTDLLDPKLPLILFDLTKYPSDAMNTKSLSLLNKFHMAKLKLFQTTQRSHALLTTESVRVHREALQSMVLLTQLSKSKLSMDMANEAVRILHTFAELCHFPHQPNKPHPIGQDILVNNGLLDLLLPMVTQEVDMRLKDRFAVSVKVVGGCLEIFRFLAMENGYVQAFLMDQLDKLLSVQCCGELQALALQEIFRGHTVHCLRLQPHHIQKIVKLAGQYKEEAPEFLNLLKIIMKMEKSGTLLKRNQHLVTKYMMENYKSAAYPMNQAPGKRLKMLIGREGTDHQRYLSLLIELLATCSEGENRYIESLCQTLISVPELLCILNNRNVSMPCKVGSARYFVWAYLRTARNPVESGVDDLPHDPHMWKHIQIIWTLLLKVNKMKNETRMLTQEAGSRTTISTIGRYGRNGRTDSVNSRQSMPKTPTTYDPWNPDAVLNPLACSTPSSTLGPEVDVTAIGRYMLGGGFLLIETFFSKFYKDDKELYPEEHDILKRLASAVIMFTESAANLAESQEELKMMVACVETLVASLQVTQSALDKVCAETNMSSTLITMKEKLDKDDTPSYNKEEIMINTMMHRFGGHLAQYLQGQNTLGGQIKLGGKRSLEPYVPEELEVKIPLGLEFQEHMRSFNPLCKDKQRFKRLIDHLEIAAKNVQNSRFVPEEDLDLRCLQILRTVLYNQVMCLPDGWEIEPHKHTKVLDVILFIQGMFLDHNIIRKIGPLLGRRTEIAMEVLSLYDLLLFNANRKAQELLLKYFTETAEEVFFIFVRARLRVANIALKERRSIKAQNEAKKQETLKKIANLEDSDEHPTDKTKKKKKSRFDKKAMKKKSLAPFFRRKMANRLLVYEEETDGSQDGLNLGLINPAFEEEEDTAEEVTSIGNYQDGSDVVLVFRVLAGMCDGQYQPLQDYLRIQPDNLCKVNMVAEATQFLAGLYTHVDGETIDLTSQAFSALQEIAENNQENRVVVMNNKIIDYMNYILRMPIFEDCEPTQVVELKTSVMALIQSMIEENGPASSQLAKEVSDTVDRRAIERHIHQAYSVIVEGKNDVQRVYCGTESNDPRAGRRKVSKAMKEVISNLGYISTLVIARFFDVDRRLEKRGFEDLDTRRAFYYFRNQIQSVEIVKNDNLQKVYFRVKNPELLREVVIEDVKWNIDRTSASNKLRDLLSWSKDIIKDIAYQEKVLSNPLPKQLAKRWSIWNYACILLSLAINIMMLISWDSPASTNDIASNATNLAQAYLTPVPRIEWSSYELFLIILGVCHNFCSLMLFICYLLLRHPRLPDCSFFKRCARKCRKKKDDLGEEEEQIAEESPSRLQDNLFSAASLYYIMCMTLSFAGTFFYGYFFAFHLVNIIATNELLKGVIKAVTQNGRSLIWVGVMGLIVIYLYALVAFAFMRAIFDEGEELYCNHLYECFVTVLRYGVIGDITDKFKMHHLHKNFQIFGLMTLYQLTFFILFTTIGLNVIFGIIVDTFSELRDLKWTAEKDMRDVCFICSRDSYDFEHEGLGFNHHVKHEHNMWAYVFYFRYLRSIQENECRSIDLYVLNMLKKDKLDFFPINRALCLVGTDDDEEIDDKLDDVVATLHEIRSKQHQEDEMRRREAERRRQETWQDQYRRSAEGRPATSSTINGEDVGSVAGESTA